MRCFLPPARPRLFVLSCLSALCVGCVVHEQAPAIDMPTQWQTRDIALLQAAEPARPDAPPARTPADWWHGYGDPVLDQLIADVLAANNDLRAASIRIRRAQLRAGLAATDLVPDVQSGGDAEVSRAFDAPHVRRTGHLYATFQYELDVWQKLAAQRDAAHWAFAAIQADYAAARLSLIGTTAGLYWQLGYLNQQIASADADIADARRTLALTHTRHAAGAVSALDLAQAERDLSARRAEQTLLVQQRTESRHALAILFDRPPQQQRAEPRELPRQPLPTVPAGLPAEVLARRPDLRALEFRLHEALANVTAARADFYPSFSLTGSLGTASDQLERVLSNPAAALGLSLVLPFVQWNTLQLRLEISRTQYEEAVVDFRQRLYAALSEVENALSACAQLERQSAYDASSLEHARQAATLARIRFAAGATGIQPWIDQQRRLREARNAEASTRLALLNSRMNLYRALGGSDR